MLKEKTTISITGWDNFTSGSGLKVLAQTGTLRADIADQLKKKAKCPNQLYKPGKHNSTSSLKW